MSLDHAMTGRAFSPQLSQTLPAHDIYAATPYFAGLDVLRAFAILAVIWHHTAANAFTIQISHKGYHGVTLFFAISGFLIVTLLLREKARTNAIAMVPFIIKRALRILPLYYAVLLTYLLLVVWFEKDTVARAQFFDNLPAFATFTTNWLINIDAPRVIFYFAWSLAAEEQFYLVWPWIEKVRLGKYFGLIAAIAAVALSPDFAAALWPVSEPQPLALRMVSLLPGAIGLGVILAHIFHEPALFKWLVPVIGRRGSAAALLLMLVTLVSFDTGIGAFEPALVDILCMLLVGAVVIRQDNDLAIFARIPGVVHIGIVSYGLYLFHMLAANAVKLAGKPLGLDSGVPLFLGTIALALVVASVSHVTFERSMLRLRNRFLAR